MDPYAGHRLERGRLTGRQQFEADSTLAASDTALPADAEAGPPPPASGSAGASGGGGFEYAVDAARYAGERDLLPADDDEDGDEDYVPGGEEDDDEDDEDED